MPLHGIQMIVKQSASVVWPNEPPASPELVALFDALPVLFDLESKREPEIRGILDRIKGDYLQPSLDLRRLYWSGRLFQMRGDHKQAFIFFSHARDIATDHNQVAWKLELSHCMATEQYDTLNSANALDMYREMLGIWENAAPNKIERRLDTEIQIRAFICRQEWYIGEFDAAHGNLARVLTKAMDVRGTQQSPELRKEIANALWDLALALRSDSDLADGNLDMLNQASRRMQKARGIFKSIGVDHYVLARIDIQVADIYYDIAELHLQRNSGEAARAMRDRGEDIAREARETLVDTDDAAAPLLEQIVSLRPHIMWPKSAAPAKRARQLTNEEIETRLMDIERQSAALKDNFLIAKAATLRADWLMMLGEWDKARIALELAIEGFGENGKGMATRAERLMRQLPPAHKPERHYGGGDPERSGRN